MRQRVLLSNRIAVLPSWWESNLEVPEERALPGYFTYTLPHAKFTPAGKNGWKGEICKMDGERVPAGLFRAVQPAMEADGWEFEVKDITRPTIIGPWTDALRSKLCPANPTDAERIRADMQLEAVDFMAECSRTGGGILIAATGFGKTYAAGIYFARLKGRGIFLVDKTDLGLQARADISKVTGEDIGFIGDGIFEPKRITVALVQSLSLAHKHPEYLKAFQNLNAMLVDEMHVALNDRTWETIIKYNPQTCIGMTATLDLDEAHVRVPAYSMTGPLVHRVTYRQAVAANVLVPGYAYCVNIDTANYEVAEDTKPIDVYRQHVINFAWLNTYVVYLAQQAIAAGYTVCVLASMHEHLHTLAGIADALGVEYALYSGRVATAERTYHRALMSKRDLKLIIGTVDTLTKGMSIPTLDFVIDAAQSRDWKNTVQRAGRGTRLSGGKDHFVYIDVATTSKRRSTMFASRAVERRRGLKATGYTIHRVNLAGITEAEQAAAATFDSVLRS